MRTVHYCAAGRNGLAFACYFAGLKAARESPRVPLGPQDIRYPRSRPSVPWPLRHTDLGRVTCPECWRSIVALGVRKRWLP